jgi:CoA-transferase family III
VGIPGVVRARCGTPCAVRDWARWGLLELTGWPGEPPLAPHGPVANRVAALVADLAAATGAVGGAVAVDPRLELTGRAREAGWTRAGRRSANGHCHLLRAADGWLAVNLARPDDVAAIPAVLEDAAVADPLAALAAAAARTPAAVLASRCHLLDVPAAVLAGHAGAAVRATRLGRPGGAGGRLVVDFSALWAGPLAASVLRRAGFDVVTAEHPARPDGSRRGSPGLHARLHEGCRALGWDAALDLVERADVVVEASRPRALARLGLVAPRWLAARPGRTWLSITGYGRSDPAGRAAFGDDAAVAGGLVAWDREGAPVFCGDAIADPLTGLTAALAVCRSLAAGGGDLIDVAMAGVCAGVAAPGDRPVREHAVAEDGSGGWVVRHVDAAARR